MQAFSYLSILLAFPFSLIRKPQKGRKPRLTPFNVYILFSCRIPYCYPKVVPTYHFVGVYKNVSQELFICMIDSLRLDITQI